ncbi:hypothetical protein LOC68_18750 [Blastopirellula sp. JC732]|uniref:Uncharacterized protein n=1 Tax=Blastopirellula sediminis TaxID=2894196 RepID=A0A9X1MRT4_9BACT|nr:hypothetical protein [Blastopirellula sediminis]MCC9606263.1 hypothetical protein [Blastopirellula sediminis]MCC9630439.1 hypothetical protein [Blastopirellula sediminis]
MTVTPPAISAHLISDACIKQISDHRRAKAPIFPDFVAKSINSAAFIAACANFNNRATAKKRFAAHAAQSGWSSGGQSYASCERRQSRRNL